MGRKSFKAAHTTGKAKASFSDQSSNQVKSQEKIPVFGEQHD